jgi:hypothetical protein
MGKISFRPAPIIVAQFSTTKVLQERNNTLERNGLLNIDKDAFLSCISTLI